MTLVATFLYALLTDRILLVDRGTDMSDLFCEPFPNSSWFLPVDFPQSWLEGLNRSNPYRFGHLIDKGKCSVHVNVSSIPVYSYVDLTHSFDLQDRRFFCEEEQKVLNQIPWLFLRTNIYFVPSLYFVPPLNKKLEKFFPQREALFHHLARYLFHPSNDVWGRIIRFYDAYLSNVDQIVGLQIRIFDPTKTPTENVTSQVFACVLGNKILPNTSNADANEQPWAAHIVRENKVISVLVTSLHRGHYDSVRKFYLHQPTEDGSLVRVNLPSHEGEQRTDKPDHDKQALAEIFLLSFSETLVTSPMSTFGYAAQGLAGIRPWLLTRPGEDSYPNFACMKAFSVEPCFHVPPLFDCDCQGGTDPGKIIPFVRHCEDVRWGLKLSGDDVSETNFSA
ncbi:hypothetical protein O6H91_11G100700 [Diphasiastrum complanatum]|nr:hypothetical protein O6H91_11G100700 [Diphasiastrum complanatum]